MHLLDHLISKNCSLHTGYFHQSAVNLHFPNQPPHSKLLRYGMNVITL